MTNVEHFNTELEAAKKEVERFEHLLAEARGQAARLAALQYVEKHWPAEGLVLTKHGGGGAMLNRLECSKYLRPLIWAEIKRLEGKQ